MEIRAARRGFLLAGVAGAAVACTPDNAQPPHDSPGAPVSPTTPGGIATSGRAPTSADWQQLARNVSGTLARPGSATYHTVRLTQNPRYDGARPLAVLSVAGAADVATAIAFAQDHGVAVAIRSGGHSYPGWSAGDGALVVDVRPLHRVSLSGTTATVGAGASLVQVYDALGTRGRGIAGGSCPTVGIAGLTQGGGVGVLTRAHGLTCDAVTSMRVVLADGRTVTASADQEPDLYWALRGGGGGHLGVVTSFRMRTFAAPTITRAYLAWPFSAARRVVPHWLATAPTADRRLWSTLKLLGGAAHAGGPVLLHVGDVDRLAVGARHRAAAVPVDGADALDGLAPYRLLPRARCSPTPAAPRSRSASAIPARAAPCSARRSPRRHTSSPRTGST